MDSPSVTFNFKSVLLILKEPYQKLPLNQVRSVNDQIEDCEQRIEEHKAEKERLDMSCQDLQRQFKKLVQDNKFADFLRRIFKKKYRPPREHDDDGSMLIIIHVQIDFETYLIKCHTHKLDTMTF